MARGRKPKPTHLKLLTGNPGHRPLNIDEPNQLKPKDRWDSRTTLMDSWADVDDEGSYPPAPPELSDKAQTIWGETVRILDRMGILSESDTAVIAGYCSAYALFLELEERLKTEPMFIIANQSITTKPDGTRVERTGVLMVSPLHTNRRAAMVNVVSFAGELGLSPSSRTRITKGAAGKPDEFTGRLRGTRGQKR